MSSPSPSHTPLPPLAHLPADVVSLADYEAVSRHHLSDLAWAYLTGGAADEITLRRNREAFDAIALAPRVLRPLTEATTRTTILGQTFEYPFLLAPVAYQRLAHANGEHATADAAEAMQAGMVLSTQSSVPLEDIPQRTSAPLWFQLYIQPDREFTRTLIARAENAGYQALVVTVDAPVNGIRNREQRAGFQLPDGIEAVNLRGMMPLEPAERTLLDPPLFGTPLAQHAPTWRDLEWLLSITNLPVLIKGILSSDDAETAIDIGCSGIIVSNHGGRTLDTAVPAITALPRITQRVARKVPVLMDGGIRRGTDIVKAIALGADAVLIGRPYVHALAVAGALGVAHALGILRAEFETAMALSGCARVGDISADILWNT